jgi:splicing factor 3B subunit 3
MSPHCPGYCAFYAGQYLAVDPKGRAIMVAAV